MYKNICNANETTREEYLDGIKKLLPKIHTVEAMKSIYEMATICMINEANSIKADGRGNY